MEFFNNYIIPVFVPSLMTAVMLLLVAILYNVRCTRLMKAQENTQQKEPEENDERFATGKSDFAGRLVYYCHYDLTQKAFVNYLHLQLFPSIQ